MPSIHIFPGGIFAKFLQSGSDLIIKDSVKINITNTGMSVAPGNNYMAVWALNKLSVLNNASFSVITDQAPSTTIDNIQAKELTLNTTGKVVSKVTLTDGSSDYNKQNSRAFRAANSADAVNHTFARTGEYEFQVTNGSKAMTFHANGTIILNDGLKILTPTDGRVAAVSGAQDIVDTTNNPDQPHVLIGQPAPTHALTVNCGNPGEGVCTPATGIYDENHHMVFTATANAGYVIDTFEYVGMGVSDTDSGSPSLTSDIDFDRDITINITFKVKDANTTYKVTTRALPDNGTGGTVVVNKENALVGDNITVTTTPKPGKKLSSLVWYKSDEPETKHDILATKTFAMPESAVWVVATFEDDTTPPTTYAVTFNCGANGTCTKDPDQTTYDDGSDVTVFIHADAGYVIESLKVNGVDEVGVVGFDNLGTNITMDEDKTVDVVFKKAPIALSTDKATVKQDEELKITLENASEHNGKTVVFWLNSDPIKLGEAIVTDGKVTFTAKVPCGVKPGDHTITATIDGNPVGAAVAVTVLSSPTCPTTGTPATGIGGQALTTLVAALTLVATGFGINKKFAKKF